MLTQKLSRLGTNKNYVRGIKQNTSVNRLVPNLSSTSPFFLRVKFVDKKKQRY